MSIIINGVEYTGEEAERRSISMLPDYNAGRKAAFEYVERMIDYFCGEQEEQEHE